MRFLRMLTNSLLAGALGAAYLTVLVLQLNPQIPLAVEHDLARGIATLGAVLRRSPRGHCSMSSIVLREFFALRRALARLGQRARAGVDGCRRGGGRGRR